MDKKKKTMMNNWHFSYDKLDFVVIYFRNTRLQLEFFENSMKQIVKYDKMFEWLIDIVLRRLTLDDDHV